MTAPSPAPVRFTIIDYCVFSSMLVLSAACGIYFGYFKKHVEAVPAEKSKSNNREFGSSAMNEYLLGSRKLKIFPVAMSLVASYVSGVTILGTPAEIYNYGTQYWMMVVPIYLMGFTVATVYLPVFTSLKLGSSYEYLELRFNSAVRTIASVMFVLDEIFFLPMIIYVPSLAFNQVSNINLFLIGAIVTVVCVFYTLVGGIKAVVSTDAWQVIIMFISVVVIIILGTISIGGPIEAFDRTNKGGRIEFFNINPSMYERQTFWGVLIGGYVYWTAFNSVNQTMVQRYMSLPNLKKARKSIAIFTVGISLFVSACCYAGVLIFAKYYRCDPLTHNLVKSDDQLLPHYVMDEVGHLVGIPGLFVAGVFGAALSSLSVVLNSTACVLLEDILKGFFGCRPSEKQAFWFVKSCIIILGTIAMGCLFIVEKLGGILSVATSLTAISAGTTCGIFTLGMLVPWSNAKGALVGGVSGALMSGWVSLGSQFATATGQITAHRLDVSIADCPMEINGEWVTEIIREYPDESGVFPLYRLSFHWITPIGILTVLIVGTITSFLTQPRDLKHIDPELISPVIHKYLPQACFSNYGITILNRDKDPSESVEEMVSGTNGAKEGGSRYIGGRNVPNGVKVML